MLQNIKRSGNDGRILLMAMAAWSVSALILLCIGAMILSRVGIGESAIGYVSSALSFLTAVSAGVVIGRAKPDGVIYPALLTGAVLTTCLLTIGFIAEGSRLEASGVLSVVSFTFAGCLAGAVLFTGRGHKKHKMHYRK